MTFFAKALQWRQRMWQRIDDARLRNIGGRDNKIAFRCYGLDGKPWPRIVLAVCRSYYADGGLIVSLNRKDRPGEWWGNNFGLPEELLPELADLLWSVHNELSESNKAREGKKKTIQTKQGI